MREVEQRIKQILTPQQYRRYQELSLQMQGPVGVMRPEVLQKLQVTDDQRQQILQILESNMPPRPTEGQRPDPAEMRKHREEVMKKVLGVLNSSQQDQWKSMLGKPFKFDDNVRTGGFGGPPPGGGFGGGQGGPPPGGFGGGQGGPPPGGFGGGQGGPPPDGGSDPSSP